MAAPYQRHSLIIGGVDYTDYLVPQSFSLTQQVANGVFEQLDFVLKQAPGSFAVDGGSFVEFYLEGATAPLFSGFHTVTMPGRYAPQTWQYTCSASGWQSVFTRKQLFTALRGVTYEGAVNQILTDEDQALPANLLTTVLDSKGLLAGDMPFFAVNGAFPSEIFDLIANLTGTIWRVNYDGTNAQLEFLDPFNTFGGLQLNQTSYTFKWNTFQPTISLASIINSQSVKGNQSAVDTEDVVYFRGDGLSSKFNLPTKPFNNEASVVLFDSFNGNNLNTGLWFESDIVGDYVYPDGVGFVQYTDTANSWVGLISRPLAARSGNPLTTIDINWVQNGVAMIGLTELNEVPVDPYKFLEAGVYIDSGGTVFGVSGGVITGPSGVTLAEGSQYRFRFKIKASGGCRIEYQEGADIYSRNWTLLGETTSGDGSTLGTAVMSYSAGMSLAMAKTVYPYLGVKLEVDRGAGYLEEEVGIYPIDEDVDAVILEESTLAFFGSDPGPSTIPPAPSWQTDPDYKNIRVTYRRGVNIFATYRDNASISDVAALFGGTDSGIREGAVIVDESVTSYQAALAKAKSEVDNRANVVERIVAETALNILTDAGYSIPKPGESLRFSITLPTTSYVISRDIPLRKTRLVGKTGLNDIALNLEAGYLKRGLRSVLQELQATGKLISINENQVIYIGKSVADSVSMTETVTSFGEGLTRQWGDSRLDKTFTVDTGTDILTLSGTSLYETGDAVRVSTSNTLPSPLSASSTYYINKQSSTTFYLYDTLANAQGGGATGRVNLTTTGTGTHTLSAGGWRYANHRWNSFMKTCELKASASLSARARVFKKATLQAEVVLNLRARVI